MSVRLAAYPTYKGSGLPWLGEIPSHWDINPGFSAFREKQHRNTGMVETTVLSLSYGRVVVKPPEKLHGLVPASFETYQIVDPGEIVIRPTDLQNDKSSLRVGIARDRGIISSAYLCLRTIGAILPEFGYLLLHAYDVKKVFYGMGSGLRQNLDFKDLKRMPVLIPSREEQSAIAAFLAYLDRRINRLIRAKRRLIQLLNEQRQIIIHGAVTRSLNPNVPLRPSGIDWLGDVPEHWETSRVKFEFECLNHRRVPLSGVERGAMISRQYDYYGASGVIDKVDDYVFDDELLLIAEDGANLVLRNLPLAIIARGKFWVNNHAHVLKPKRGNLEYLASLMETVDYRTWISGAAQPKLTQDRLMTIPIPIPPVTEQTRIVAQINEDAASSQLAVGRAQDEIDLLREYRTRMIADVVTGKLDVRGVELPTVDETEALEAIDTAEEVEADEMVDTEEVADGDE